MKFTTGTGVFTILKGYELKEADISIRDKSAEVTLTKQEKRMKSTEEILKHLKEELEYKREQADAERGHGPNNHLLTMCWAEMDLLRELIEFIEEKE